MILHPMIKKIVFDVAMRCDPILDNTIHQTILHGDFAFGRPNKHSDLKILLTLKCQSTAIPEYEEKLSGTIQELGTQYRIPIRVKLLTKEQFRLYRETIPKYREIKEKGICYTRFGMLLPNWEEGDEEL